jgi:hypothetical protein
MDKILKFKSSLVDKKDEYKELVSAARSSFAKYHKFNIGDYLHPYHCIHNLGLNGCSLKCKNDKNCVGFEYNKTLQRFNKSVNEKEKLKDLCCLKKNIGPFISRTGKYNNGSFYLKSRYHPLKGTTEKDYDDSEVDFDISDKDENTKDDEDAENTEDSEDAIEN